MIIIFEIYFNHEISSVYKGDMFDIINVVKKQFVIALKSGFDLIPVDCVLDSSFSLMEWIQGRSFPFCFWGRHLLLCLTKIA